MNEDFVNPTDREGISRKSYQIAIFTACDAPLEELDLRFINVKFLRLEDLLSEVSTKLGESAAAEVDVSKKRWLSRWAPMHLRCLVPIDFNIVLQGGVYNRILQILLIAYPSDFRALSIVRFTATGPNTVFNEETEVNILFWRQNDMRQPLKLESQKLPALRKLFEVYFKTGIPKYLIHCIDSYTSHFYEWKMSLAYLSLCICFEALAEGKEQITYRVRRNLSIINGNTIEMSNSVYRNVGFLYDLRSKIVHGEEYDVPLLEEYLPYLKVLIASTILELISHNIGDRQELNDRINRIGFGEKIKLSDAYDPLFVNAFGLLTVKKLEKRINSNKEEES
jgi:hypothetical protein